MTVWRELHFPVEVAEQHLVGFLRALAADPMRAAVVFEVRTTAARTRYFLGADPTELSATTATMRRLIPGLTTTPPTTDRGEVERSARVHIRGRNLGLGLDAKPETLRAVLAALSAATGAGDTVALQVVLGRAVAPEILPAGAADPTASAASVLLHGARPAGRAVQARLQDKLSQYRFRAAIRLGVTSPSPVRRRLLVHGVLAALRTLQSGGTRISLATTNPVSLDAGRVPAHQPLRLTAEELLPMLAWPAGSDDLPGLPARHPALLAPSSSYRPSRERVFAVTTAPGVVKPVGIPISDALRHTHIYGPTGSGKSTLFLHLIAADIAAGRSVVVIDPKRDLARDVLTLIPEYRAGQVVVIDPALDRPAGVNPFAGLHGPGVEERRALVAEIMIELFRGLFPTAFGPLTADSLHASFLTLTYAPDASLARLPKLLTDTRYRHQILRTVTDPGLQDFWAQYDEKSPGQQAAAVGPVMTRLRQFLLRPGIRAILDQPAPVFRLEQLFTTPRIVIVSLNKGLLGAQTASLLGSLVVAQLWQLILARAAAPAANRAPVSIYIDEAQQFLHLGDLSEALEQSRSLGAAWHLAHQHRTQMPDRLLAAIDANARNKIIFGLEDPESRTAARTTRLTPEDFERLPPHEIYTTLQHDGARIGWFSARVLPPPPAISDPDAILTEAQARYGTPPTTPPPSPPDNAAQACPDDAEDEPIGRTTRSPK